MSELQELLTFVSAVVSVELSHCGAVQSEPRYELSESTTDPEACTISVLLIEEKRRAHRNDRQEARQGQTLSDAAAGVGHGNVKHICLTRGRKANFDQIDRPAVNKRGCAHPRFWADTPRARAPTARVRLNMLIRKSSTNE